MSDHCVPKATLGRLPIYLQFLKSISKESRTISATTIAKELGFGDVQVRKDLGAVSREGRPRIGYITSELIERLESYLGQNSRRQVVIVGAGKLGQALLDYSGFKEYGLEIVAAFDLKSDETLTSDSGKPIYPMKEFEDYCYRGNIKVGIITVPKQAAQSVCDLMVKCNISAIWSFAPANLCVPEGVALHNENLALSLAHLTNQIN